MNNLSSSHTLILRSISSSVKASAGLVFNPKCCNPVSKERMAFINDSSKLLPIAITSPVAFIWVESLLSAVSNLSNGNLGILVTT